MKEMYKVSTLYELKVFMEAINSLNRNHKNKKKSQTQNTKRNYPTFPFVTVINYPGKRIVGEKGLQCSLPSIVT